MHEGYRICIFYFDKFWRATKFKTFGGRIYFANSAHCGEQNEVWIFK